MRKIIVSEFLSLDGVMEEPAWTAPFWNDEIAKFKFDELFAVEALLLGRQTYQGFAAAWPNQLDEQGYGERMNTMPKYVASTTLGETEWNAELLAGDTVEAIRALRQQDGGDLLVFGSRTLARTLAAHGLVDRYNFVQYPVVLGAGARLFDGEGVPAALELVAAKVTPTGAIALSYDVTGAEVAGIPG